MEDKERANMVLKRIGEMPYFDPEAIVKVLVDEFELVRKEAAQSHAQGKLCACKCPGFDVGKPDICPTCGKPHR